jgi:hypothetical protein
VDIVTTPPPVAPTFFRAFPANPNSIRRIDTGLVKDAQLAGEPLRPDDEIDGLKIYKFRGSDSMAGYVPPPVNWSQARLFTAPARPTRPPAILPGTRRPERPPPFPTRHTTRRPDQPHNPVIIIAQRRVQMN